MNKFTEMIIAAPVTMLRELRAFKNNKKINPRATDEEMDIFFRKKLRVNVSAKNNGIKNERICNIVA